MNAKIFKNLLARLNPLRSKIIPVIDALQLFADKLVFTNLMMEVEIVSDNRATGILSFDEIRKIAGSLDNNDDINFENDEAVPEKILILVNGEVIGSLASVGPIKELPISFAKDRVFDDHLGRLTAELKGYWKEALDYVTDDELRPAMQCVNLCDQVQATDGHLLYFKNLQSPVKWFRKSPGFVEIDKWERERYLENRSIDNLAVPGDWVKTLKGWLKPENIDITAKVGKKESQFILEMMEEAEIYAHLEEIKDMESDHEFPVFVERNPYLLFSSTGMNVHIKMIGERFPDIRSVIPTRSNSWINAKQHYMTNEVELEIDKKLFIKWIRTALTFANHTTYQVRLTIGDGEVKISTEDLDYSKEFSRSLECNTTRYELNEELSYLDQIGFNGQYLLKCVQKTKSDAFKIWMTQGNRAAIIDGYLLIMPVMLNEYV